MTVAYQETREVPLDQLVPFPGNAKRGDIPKLRESLRSGQYRSLVVRAMPDGALMILAGNNTALAMREEGWAAARCEIIACDDEQAKRINVKDNRLGELGEVDRSALAQIMASFDTPDYSDVGFETDEVDALLRSVDYLGNQATAFLDNVINPPAPAPGPVGATHNPASAPPPASAVPPGAGDPDQPVPAAEPAAGGVNLPPAPSPTPPPTPGPAYVPISWMVLPEDRDIIREAIRLCQAVTGADTAALALVEVARHYTAAQEAQQ